MSVLTVSRQKTTLVSPTRLPEAVPSAGALNVVKQQPISVNSPSVVVKLSQGSTLAAASTTLDPTTLNAVNIGSYSVSQLMGFVPSQVVKISNLALTGLSNTQLGGLDKSFFQAMSAGQVKAFSASQLLAIGSNNIGSLNTAVKTNTSTDRALALASLGQTNISISDSSSNFTNNLSAINSSSAKISSIKFSDTSPKLQLSYQ
jgi:hypothetical protein